MDVGADRIARTAKAALDLLGEIRRILNRPILPGWMPGNVQDDAVLENLPRRLSEGPRAALSGIQEKQSAPGAGGNSCRLKGTYGFGML